MSIAMVGPPAPQAPQEAQEAIKAATHLSRPRSAATARVTTGLNGDVSLYSSADSGIGSGGSSVGAIGSGRDSARPSPVAPPSSAGKITTSSLVSSSSPAAPGPPTTIAALGHWAPGNNERFCAWIVSSHCQ